MTTLPLLVEGGVAVLLLVTIGYCATLERRMRKFHEGQADLRQLVVELDRATRQAENAVHGLSEATRGAESSLDARLAEAKLLAKTLALGNRTSHSKLRKAG